MFLNELPLTTRNEEERTYYVREKGAEEYIWP
jgi:hypothetical protein